MKTIAFAWPLPDGKIQRLDRIIFERVGEGISLHSHNFFHPTCVCEGKVELYDDLGKSVILGPGEIRGYKAGRKHGIRAVEVPAEIIHPPEPGANRHGD